MKFLLSAVLNFQTLLLDSYQPKYVTQDRFKAFYITDDVLNVCFMCKFLYFRRPYITLCAMYF